MSKQEFLRRLESGLAGVAPDERVAAVQYYTEYFDDAGAEHEAEVLEELGDPDKLAADIKAVSELVEETPGEPGNEAPQALEAETVTIVQDPFDLAEVPAAPDVPKAPEMPAAPGMPGSAPAGTAPSPAMVQNGQVPPQYQFPGGYVPPRYGMQAQGQPYYAPGGPGQPGPYTQRPVSSGGATVAKVLLIILAVMFSPALLGVGVAAVVCLLMFLLTPFIAGIAFVGGGIGVFMASLLVMGGSVGSGILIFGLALLLVALGMLLCWAGFKLVTKAIPALFRGIASIFRSLFGSKKEA